MLALLASPFNCIYSAAKLEAEPADIPRPRSWARAPSSSSSTCAARTGGKRFDGYFRKGLPYLDGFKAYFVKSNAVVPGLLGGQFDAEFRGRNPDRARPAARQDEGQGRRPRGAVGGSLMLHLQHQEKAVRRHSRAPGPVAGHRSLDRRRDLAKISILKHVGGFIRPGSTMALPRGGAGEAAGLRKDIEKSRAEAEKLLKEAGRREPHLQVPQPHVAEPYTPGGVYASTSGGASASRPSTSSSRPSSIRTACCRQFRRGDGIHLRLPRRPHTAIRQIPDARRLTPLGYSGHEDTKIDELYEQRAAPSIPWSAQDRAGASTLCSHDGLLGAVPVEPAHRRLPEEDQGWHMSPSHYIPQDLVEVWLDQ